MKFIFRWLFRLLVLGVVLVVALMLSKDVLGRELLENRLRAVTGLETRIGRCEIGLFSPCLTLEDLRFYNPPAFGGAPFLEIPELHVEYDRPALAQGRLHLTLLRLDVAVMTIVDGPGGQSNLQAVWAALPSPSATEPRLEFAGIDTLNLSFGALKRYALATPARVQTVDLGIRNAVFTNLRTGNDFTPLVAQLALRFGLGSLHVPVRPAPPAAR